MKKISTPARESAEIDALGPEQFDLRNRGAVHALHHHDRLAAVVPRCTSGTTSSDQGLKLQRSCESSSGYRAWGFELGSCCLRLPSNSATTSPGA